MNLLGIDYGTTSVKAALFDEKLNQIMSERTGQPLDVIQRDTERDHFLSAQQAVEYGLIDKVIDKR